MKSKVVLSLICIECETVANECMECRKEFMIKEQIVCDGVGLHFCSECAEEIKEES